MSITAARAAVDALTVLREIGNSPIATSVHLDRLRLWPGWGVLAPAMASQPSGPWVKVADDLDRLLTADERDAASRVVDTSFYTPRRLGDLMWKLLVDAGFDGGRVLDLGCGHGALMAAAPALPLEFTGVDADPVATRIAGLLHPVADIRTGDLARIALPNDAFDAVVANVPFSSSKVHHAETRTYLSLHQHFLMRAASAVRPGGYIVAITSRYTIDAMTTRDPYGNTFHGASLVAALRLPSGLFPGTDVVADVLVLQVPVTGDPAPLPRGRHIVGGPSADGSPTPTVQVHAYWADRPGHVAGKMEATGHHMNPLRVVSSEPWTDVTRVFAAATRSGLPRVPARTDLCVTADSSVVLADSDGRKERSFHIADDGNVFTVSDGKLAPVPRAGKELRALIALRDAAAALIDLESDADLPGDVVQPARDHALGLYTAYVDQFGPLNRATVSEGEIDSDTGSPKITVRRPAMGGFRRDPDYPLVLALENYDPDTATASPAEILLRRIHTRRPRVDRVDTPAEALAITLGEVGHLDLGRAADLLGLGSAVEAAAALGDLIYRDPAVVGDWLPARDYLSGDVRAKLVAAIAAAKVDPAYQRNVDALQQVQPADLTAADVRINLGAPWLQASDVAAFITEVLCPIGGRIPNVEHTPAAAVWDVHPDRIRASAAAQLTYGTDRFAPAELLQHGLNGRRPVAYDSVYDVATGSTRKVRNPQATAAACDKLEALNERFSLWVYEDRDRHDRILEDYNRRFNAQVARRLDGSYIQVPGLAEGKVLRDNQKNALDLALSTDRCGVFHSVGAGKTWVMLSLAVLLRRYGIANKPCITVPKNLLEQIGREALQLFPAGRFLIATDEDLHKDARRLFAARCATGDWDAVILTHEAFTSLRVEPITEEAWIGEQIAQMRQAEISAGRSGAKQIARSIRSLENRLYQLRDNGADVEQVSIEQLGIDYLAVDEADKFLRLPVATRTDGFSLGSSKRAADMLLKMDTLAQRYPHRPVVSVFTGTPFRNTLAEIYCWTRMLAPRQLERMGLTHFDAFAAVFIRWETRIEVSPEGAGFRINSRPSTIQNLPELRRLLDTFADLQSAEALGLERPDRRDHTIVLEPDQATTDYVGTLVARAEAIRSGGSADKGDDNMLAVCGDGRMAALDPNLVAIRGATTKLTAVADCAADIYYGSCSADYGTDKLGALQLVLCDLGTPKPGDASTYGRLRQQMIMRGIPADKIRFAHEATTPKARETLHARCRDGSIAVLIGSTQMVGIGTNIQTRVAAVHMVAPPWRPSDIEQGQGRAFRPGNLNEVVDVHTYVLSGTFDAFSWETLARKQRAFWHLYSADPRVREIDDVSELSMSYEEVKAAASGNSMLLEEAEAKAALRTLQVRYSTFLQNRRSAEQRADLLAERVEVLHRRGQLLEELAETILHLPISAADLADAIDRALVHGSAQCGPVTVMPARNTSHGPAIDVAYKRVPVCTVPVTRAAVRKGGQVIAPKILHELGCLEDLRSRVAAALGKARTEQTDTAIAAAAAVFADEQALAAAEARLAAVQAQIADCATEGNAVA